MSLGFILLLSPILFQLLYGSIALSGNARISFKVVCLVSIIAEIIFSVMGYINVSNELDRTHFRCGMPLMAFLIVTVFIGMILVTIIGIQLLVRYFKQQRKIKNLTS